MNYITIPLVTVVIPVTLAGLTMGSKLNEPMSFLRLQGTPIKEGTFDDRIHLDQLPVAPAHDVMPARTIDPALFPQPDGPLSKSSESSGLPQWDQPDQAFIMQTTLAPEDSDAAPWSKLPHALRPYAATFTAAGEKHGIDPWFLACISMHETGNGTSSAFLRRKNAMGVCKEGKGPSTFKTVAASIFYQARRLADPRGPYRHCETVADYGKVYCPLYAKNDPRGLNKHWIPAITQKLRKFNPNSPLL